MESDNYQFLYDFFELILFQKIIVDCRSNNNFLTYQF